MTATAPPSEAIPTTEVLAYLLEDGLSRLAHHFSDLPTRDIPALAVSVDSGLITAYCSTTAPTDPPAPWTAGRQPNELTVDMQDLQPETATATTLPVLVIAGITTHRDILVLNLTALGTLGVTGPNALAICRSWTYQLLLSPDTLTITSADPNLIPHTTTRSTLHDPHQPPPPATVTYTPADTPLPDTIVINHTTADDMPNMLFAPADRSAEIFCGPYHYTLWRTFDLDNDTWSHLSDLTHLTPAEPAGNEDVTLPHLWVRVLGPIEVAAPPTADDDTPYSIQATTGVGTPNRDTELLTRLALAGDKGISTDTAIGILWPDQPADAKLRRRLVEQLTGLRRSFGPVPDSDERIILPRLRGASTAALKINPHITCDWTVFQTLIPTTHAKAPTENLRAALTLVRGRPFHDAPEDRYEWAKHIIDTALDFIAATALELATRELENGDTAAAYEAARAGLATNPERQDLWCIALNAAPPTDIPTLIAELRNAIPNREIDRRTRTVMERVTPA